MKYFVRKSIAIMIALCAIFSMSLTAFASSTTSQYNNTIVLRTEEDWAKMRQHDLAEYNANIRNNITGKWYLCNIVVYRIY